MDHGNWHFGFHRHVGGLLAIALIGLGWAQLIADDSAKGSAKLLAHWPLREDARDVVGSAHGKPENVTFGVGPAGSPIAVALFNGRDGRIEVRDSGVLDVGTRDFSVAVWIRCATPFRSTLGDLICKFDPVGRRGINLHVAGSSPAYNAMSDSRHVHFGIDDDYRSAPEDHGKPWPSNSLITNLIVFDEVLYCGIADADRPQDKARVFRFAGGKKWLDCGRLGDDPNHHSVQSMVVHQGKLYAGTGIWNWVQALGGLKDAPSAALPRVFVYEGGTRWRDIGQVGSGSRIMCLASFNGELYAGIDKRGQGHAYKYDGQNWIDCGSPDGRNCECFLPLGGTLFAATHGNVYQYLGGQNWKRIGADPHQINQIHCMEVFAGKIVLGTWPQGYVLRYEGGDSWQKIGRLGLPEGPKLCNEINDLTVYNGKLYAGVIPKAELYRFETAGDWTRIGALARRLDWDVDSLSTWLRVTALASFQGRLFAGTGSCQGRALDAPVDPSLGRVSSFQAGQVVSHERDIGGDWTHVAAVRRGRGLELYINGKRSASSRLERAALLNLSSEAPLWIGFGAQNFFDGAMADLRLYDGALDAESIRKLAASPAARAAAGEALVPQHGGKLQLLAPNAE